MPRLKIELFADFTDFPIFGHLGTAATIGTVWAPPGQAEKPRLEIVKPTFYCTFRKLGQRGARIHGRRDATCKTGVANPVGACANGHFCMKAVATAAICAMNSSHGLEECLVVGLARPDGHKLAQMKLAAAMELGPFGGGGVFISWASSVGE